MGRGTRILLGLSHCPQLFGASSEAAQVLFQALVGAGVPRVWVEAK